MVEFKILKKYININLANNLIRLLKLPVKATILFIQKLDNNCCLYVYYSRLNNLKIRNQ